MLLDSGSLYLPATLPIFGTYDDYGGVEKIVEDENTKLIEAFFEMSIDKFVDYITSGRHDIGNTYGSPIKFFATPEKKKFLMEHGNYYSFGKRWLKAMGFVQLKICGLLGKRKNMFSHPDVADYYVSIYNTKFKGKPFDAKYKVGAKTHTSIGFIIYRKSGLHLDKESDQTNKIDPYNPKRRFIEEWYRLTGAIVYADKKDWPRIDTLNRMSGMFVHKKIYSAMANATANGADKMYSWLEDEYRPQAVYNEFQKVAKNCGNINTISYDGHELTRHGTYEVMNTSFILHFREWLFFKEIYLDALINNKLKDATIDWINFAIGMYSCNRFFFPGMNGEQCGNSVASRYLLETSLEILDGLEGGTVNI